MDFAINSLDLKGPQVGFNSGIIYEGTGNNRKVIYNKNIETYVAKNIIEKLHLEFPNVSISFYDENS